jgi:hypothetical protein
LPALLVDVVAQSLEQDLHSALRLDFFRENTLPIESGDEDLIAKRLAGRGGPDSDGEIGPINTPCEDNGCDHHRACHYSESDA